MEKIAGQEALPGQLADLLADQLLFVEAVAQAFLGDGRVEAQLLLHVVRTEPGAVIGEARIGLDQHVAVVGDDRAEQIRKVESTDIDKFGHVSYHYAIDCDGVIYEALDIRQKGAHIARGNTGAIGIVMLADLSVRGEAYKEEYQQKSMWGKIKGVFDWGPDKLDVATDEPQNKQIKALFELVKVLRKYFKIEKLGGHREFQKITTGDGRACPGVYGMSLVRMLREQYGLAAPK